MTQPWRSLRDVEITFVDTFDKAMACARWLSTQSRIAVDVETTGLSIQRDAVRLVQLGDVNTAYAIPLEGSTVSYLERNAHDGFVVHNNVAAGWGGFVIDLLRRYDGEIIMHNAKFDHSHLGAYLGLDLPRHKIHDTRLLLHVLDSQTPLSLKDAATKYVDPYAALGQRELDKGFGKGKWQWDTVPVSHGPYWFYGGLDTILTARLFEKLYPQVQETAPRSYELELAVSWPCADMEMHGVHLDVPYTEQYLRDLLIKVAELENQCKSQYGVAPGSTTKLIRVLVDDGVNLIKRTTSGAQFSLDKEVLSGLDHPLAQLVLDFRQTQHMSTYLSSYLKLQHNGMIYPSINTVGGLSKNPYDAGGGMGVRTGRMSSSNPNLQNVPKRTAVGSAIRRCFIPADGNLWLKCDADQIESRTMAHLSNDQGLLAAFSSGEDFFVNLARQIFDEPDFQKSDPRRQLVKNGMYAKIYGAGPEKYAQTARVELAQAEKFMKDFDTSFPGVPQFIRRVERLARERHTTEGEAYVRSPLSGRKHVVQIRKVYPIVNYLVQGLAAEILKLKIVAAADAGLGQFMLFPVHDEIDFDIPEDLMPDAQATINDVMNDTELLRVPVTWSSDIGKTWGDCD